MHIRISLGAKFQLKLTISIFWTKFGQKRRLQPKSKQVHSAIELFIFQLVLATTKFQLKLRILIFWIKFAQKGSFWSGKK